VYSPLLYTSSTVYPINVPENSLHWVMCEEEEVRMIGGEVARGGGGGGGGCEEGRGGDKEVRNVEEVLTSSPSRSTA